MNFTKLQNNRFKFLCNDPKYGELLKSAHKNWKNNDSKIKFGDFGIKIIPFNTKYIVKNDGTSCLIGSAITNLISKKLRTIEEIVIIKYNISAEEMWSILYGFDGTLYFGNIKSAYNFGKEIRYLFKKRTAIIK